MDSLLVPFLLVLVGVGGGMASQRFRPSGRAALVLTCVPILGALLTILIPGGTAVTWLGPSLVLIGVPLALGYALHALRAPDYGGAVASLILLIAPTALFFLFLIKVIFHVISRLA